MSLTDVKRGRRVRFVASEAGPELYGRLSAMGLVPGAKIEVIQNAMGGPFIIAIGGTRVALGRDMACRILVT